MTQAQRSGLRAINRVAAADRAIRPMTDRALRKQVLPEDGRRFAPSGAKTLYDMFEADYTLDFMRMGTFQRLGSVLEVTLRDYYMERRSLTRPGLDSDLRGVGKQFSGAVFQRVKPGGAGNVQSLFSSAFGFELNDGKGFDAVQEYFVHRHLYTHRDGRVDERYLTDLEAVSGADERARVEAAVLEQAGVQSVEEADVYWFEPLRQHFSRYIDAAASVVRDLPAA